MVMVRVIGTAAAATIGAGPTVTYCVTVAVATLLEVNKDDTVVVDRDREDDEDDKEMG